MIENSPIAHRSISKSFAKLQKATSDGKFRVKSLRIKTLQNQIDEHLNKKLGLPLIFPNRMQKQIKTASPKQFDLINDEGKIVKLKSKSAKIIQKNYELELNNLGISSQFLQNLYKIKSEQNDNRTSQQRYLLFIKNFAIRLCKQKSLIIGQLGFENKGLLLFLQWLINWNGHITQLDLTLGIDLLKQSKMKIIKILLQKDISLISYKLCNNSLNGQEINQIFNIINNLQHIFSLDLSNNTSQALNRFGQQIKILQQFIKNNKSVCILKLNNMQLKRQGLQSIYKGISQRKINPLRILSISSNYIIGSKSIGQYLHGLLRSGLIRLDISDNPLGQQFYKNLPILKSTTIQQLNLSSTNMNSQYLYQFLQKIQQSKSLLVLIIDHNDFSHHWFSKIGQKIQSNNSLELLSMNNCQIKSFMSIFQGLTQNKYLKKLYANNNAVDCDDQTFKRLYDCFTYNKDLQQLKIKFCSLKNHFLIQLFRSISNHKKLKLLDISENLLQDAGAQAILTMLQKNCRIEYLGIDKLQFSQHLRSKIQNKMIQNKTIREREQRSNLQNLTQNMRSIDQYSWEDVDRYQTQQQQLEQKQKKLEEKVAKLQDMVAKRKQKAAISIQELKTFKKETQDAIKQKIRQQNQKVQIIEKQIKELEKKENNIHGEQQRQVRNIQKLQENLKAQNLKIKQRQTQLEEAYRNYKYLQRKRKSKDRIQNSPNRKPSMGYKHQH